MFFRGLNQVEEEGATVDACELRFSHHRFRNPGTVRFPHGNTNKIQQTFWFNRGFMAWCRVSAVHRRELLGVGWGLMVIDTLQYFAWEGQLIVTWRK